MNIETTDGQQNPTTPDKHDPELEAIHAAELARLRKGLEHILAIVSFDPQTDEQRRNVKRVVLSVVREMLAWKGGANEKYRNVIAETDAKVSELLSAEQDIE